MAAILKPRLELEFVPMREMDIDAVAAAEQGAYAFPWTRGNFVDSLQAGHSSWVCRRADQLVGYAILMMAVDEAQVLNITVLPALQRQGLGSQLLVHLFGVARGHGATRMLLEVRPGNSAGLALYRRFLFDEIGRRRGYYPGHEGREDAIVMARAL
jgi:[ribosomal protein S18]-alanine N-acetyltransferase